MARNKHSSPTLALQITDEDRQHAVESQSGGCLIADAIKRQYPNLSGVTVDMATIRVTDRERGERYIYLTPSVAQHMLLAFDQGWRHPNESVTIRRAVQIVPLTASKPERVGREQRVAELEALEASGATLTRPQKMALTKARKALARPTTTGEVDVKLDRWGAAIVRGGRPAPQGPTHPNLLRGRNRHFGAKMADPGKAFDEAVEQGVAARLQQEPGE